MHRFLDWTTEDCIRQAVRELESYVLTHIDQARSMLGQMGRAESLLEESIVPIDVHLDNSLYVIHNVVLRLKALLEAPIDEPRLTGGEPFFSNRLSSMAIA